MQTCWLALGLTLYTLSDLLSIAISLLDLADLLPDEQTHNDITFHDMPPSLQQHNQSGNKHLSTGCTDNEYIVSWSVDNKLPAVLHSWAGI